MPMGERKTIMHIFFSKIKAFILVPVILASVLITDNTLSSDMDKVKKHTLTNMPNMDQVKCLATNIYYEARMEPIQGQAAVARVVVNRVKHGFAKTPCKVVYQVTYLNMGAERPNVKVCQFSWVCEGVGKPNERDPNYQRAMKIAYEVLALDRYKEVVPRSTLFFHATHIAPNWPYRRIKQIGNHIFYSKA